MKKKIILGISFIIFFFSLLVFLYYKSNYKKELFEKKTNKSLIEKEIVETSEEKIEINLEGLVVGDSIKISTVELPEGVKPTITDRDFTIATIAAPTKMADVSTESSEETDEEETEATDAAEEDKDANTEN